MNNLEEVQTGFTQRVKDWLKNSLNLSEKAAEYLIQRSNENNWPKEFKKQMNLDLIKKINFNVSIE